MKLAVGDKAPEFEIQADNGQKISLKDLRGQKVVLYFYPKDNTPGCTREACDFQQALPHLTNTVIIGVSKDNPKKHTQFKTKYGLTFPLLADENGNVCEAYGVLDKKSLFGNTFLGITRSTFLIDEQGIIRAIWRKVKVNGHTDEVLNAIHQL